MQIDYEMGKEKNILPLVLTEHEINLDRLNMALEAGQMGTFDWDIVRDRHFWSDKTKELFGQGPGEFQGTFQDVLRIIHPEDRAMVKRKTEEYLKTGERYSLEYRVLLPNGQVRWISLRARPILNPAGVPVRLSGICWDATVTKEVELRLKESEERLRLAQLVAKVGTFEWNIQSNENRWSPEIEALYGLAPGSFKGGYEDWRKFVHPDDLPDVERLIHMSFEKGSFEAQWRVIWPDGSIHWLSCRGLVEKDQGGRPNRMIGINIDITEQKRLEVEQKKSERRFFSVFENMYEGLLLFDEDMNLIYQNPASFRIHGIDAGIIGKVEAPNIAAAWDVYDENDKPMPMEDWPVVRLLRGEKFRDIILHVRPKGVGRNFYGRYTGGRVYDTQGNFVTAFMTISDITELKLSDQALREKTEFLKEAVKVRDEFISIASHELKTPLTSLALQTQFTQRFISKGDESIYQKEKIDKMIEQNDKNIKRLARLVDDMLDIARIRSGKFSIHREKFDIVDLIHDVTEKLNNQFIHAGTELQVGECEHVIGFWDRFRVEQILINLLTNAIKYGGGRPVDLNAKRLGQIVRIAIHDQGEGIAKQNHHRIFMRFERAVSANEVSGLGLGLFISQEIAKAHSGNIWVESEPGKGSTFYIDLPVEEGGTDVL